jgi:hypothetical protein
LARGGVDGGIGSSVLTTCSNGVAWPKPFVRSHIKKVTLYDNHTGILVLFLCFNFFKTKFEH